MGSALGFANRILTGTLAGGGTDLANLQTRIGADGWQTGVDVAGGAYFTLDSGSSATKWGAVGLFQTNLSTSASMVVKLGTTLNGSNVYNSGAVSGVVAGRNCLIDLMDQEYTARYLRVELTDSSNADAEIRVGLAYAGAVSVAASGIAIGSALGLEVSTSETQTIGGQEYPLMNWSRYGWDVTFDAVDDPAVESLVVPLTRYAASGENVLFIPYDDETRMMSQSVFGRPKQTGRLSAQTANWNVNTWAFQISDRL